MAAPTWLSRLLMPMKRAGPAAPSPGLRAWRGDLGGTEARLHLRVEPNGTGLLLINASAAVRLAPTGVLMAQGLFDGADDKAILARLARSYRGPKATMADDLAHLRSVVAELAAAPGGAWPIQNLSDGDSVSAPLEEWVHVGEEATLIAELDRLWQLGVPHVTLVAGSDPAALVRGVERAEDLGMICGARIVASNLDIATLDRLVEAGLDCLQFPLVSTEADVHDALLGAGDHAAALALLDAAAERDLCAVAELVLVEATADGIRDVADLLAERSCGVLAVWAVVGDPPEALPPTAVPQLEEEVEELAESGTVHVLYTAPVQAVGPLAEQVRKGAH